MDASSPATSRQRAFYVDLDPTGPLRAAASCPTSSSSATSAAAASAPSWSGTTSCGTISSIDPLGPENLLVIAPGPLTGTYLPVVGQVLVRGHFAGHGRLRRFVDRRQPGRRAAAGGHRPAEHHRPGRRSSRSCSIDEDETRIVPMPELAGKTCLEAEGMIKDRFGTHEVKVAVIGVGRREPGALRLRQRRLVAQRRPHRAWAPSWARRTSRPSSSAAARTCPSTTSAA